MSSVFNYIQVDDNNTILGISQLSGEVNDPSMIRIDTVDNSLLGKKYINGNIIETTKTTEEALYELKQQYLPLIRDAKDLGEEEEVLKLQQEYQQGKVRIESEV